MFRMAFHDPRMMAWQNRLARLPRWAWIAIALGVVLPIFIVLAGFVLLAVVSGLVVLAAVMVILSIRNLFLRLVQPRQDDGRRNVRIVVRSARVIDP